jgi:hypothetical protein
MTTSTLVLVGILAVGWAAEMHFHRQTRKYLHRAFDSVDRAHELVRKTLDGWGESNDLIAYWRARYYEEAGQ